MKPIKAWKGWAVRWTNGNIIPDGYGTLQAWVFPKKYLAINAITEDGAISDSVEIVPVLITPLKPKKRRKQ